MPIIVTKKTGPDGKLQIDYQGPIVAQETTVVITATTAGVAPVTFNLTIRPELTLGILLAQMIDREALARTPVIDYTLHQNSSSDPRTLAGFNDGTLVEAMPNTDAGYLVPARYTNEDWSNFLAIEGTGPDTEYVMVDVTGVGCLVWIWCSTFANPEDIDYEILVYVDGSLAFNGPLLDYVGGNALVGATPSTPLSENIGGPPGTDQISERKRGHNLFFPILFSTSLKVTIKGTIDFINNRLWWITQYVTYPAGTPVQSFTTAIRDSFATTIANTNAALLGRLNTGITTGATDTTTLVGAIAAGDEKIITLTGPNSIRRLNFKLNATDLPQALRTTILEIKFDGATNPQVQAPLGDFMGTGYRISAYETLFTKVVADGTMSAAFVMPFNTSAEIKLRNTHFSQTVTVDTAEVITAPWQWDGTRDCHFYAQWREYHRISTTPERDLNCVEIAGAGIYLGTSYVFYNSDDDTAKTGNGWPLEGDERIYIDGEALPSIMGTGGDSYARAAWSRYEEYDGPFAAQPFGYGAGSFLSQEDIDAGVGTTTHNDGLILNTRFDTLAAPSFKTNFKIDFELWHWTKDIPINYAFVPYWYAKPGATHNITFNENIANYLIPTTPADFNNRQVTTSGSVVLTEVGVIESNELAVISNSAGSINLVTTPATASPAEKAGTVEVENLLTKFGLSGWTQDTHLAWRPTQVGDILTLRFDSSIAIEYRIVANMTMGNDYGIVRASVNGTDVAGFSFDAYRATVVRRNYDLGTHALVAGPNTLTFTVVGQNGTSLGFNLGVDFLSFVTPLVSQWDFDGGALTDTQGVNDFTDVGVTPTIASVLNAPGLTSGSIFFPANDSYLSTPDNILIAGTQDFTISLWINLGSLDDAQIILSKDRLGISTLRQYTILYTRSGIQFSFGNGTQAAPVNVDNNSVTILQLTWVHVAITHNATSRELAVFINGGNRVSKTYTIDPAKDPDSNISDTRLPAEPVNGELPLFLGHINGNDTLNISANSRIDRMLFYGKVLDNATIAALHSNPEVVPYS